MSESTTPRALRLAGVVFASVLGGLVLAALIAMVWVGGRGALAYGHLRAAQSEASTLRDHIADPASAKAAIASIADETSAARALTSDPVWAIAEGVPWIGAQLSAVSTIAESIDDVATTALRPLADVAASFSVDALRPKDGRVDLATFEAAQGGASSGAHGIDAATREVDDIRTSALVTPLHGAVDDVSDLLHELRDTTGALARATVLLPAMLGADGPRDYLVLFQNNAEWRSLGGNPGAMALLHTDDGEVDLVSHASTADFPRYDEPVLPLGDDVEAIYGDRPGRWMQNITQVPDFALTGALAREMWAREHGGQLLDGVIALDPVTLSYLLEATGPVTLPTGDVLTSENAVKLLLNDVYRRYTRPGEQNAFFASASVAVFDAVKSGKADPQAVLAALGRAGDEHRLLLWGAHDEDQELLADTTLSGPLPSSDANTARFGVYLNDGTGSKMDYYATADTAIGWDSCTLDASGAASGTATLTVTIANDAPVDAATLPIYITGGEYGVPLGDIRTVAYVYLPTGFDLSDATVTGDGGFGGGMHEGHRVLSFAVDLSPGESASATITVQAPPGSPPRLVVLSTPTIASSAVVAAECGEL